MKDKDELLNIMLRQWWIWGSEHFRPWDTWCVLFPISCAAEQVRSCVLLLVLWSSMMLVTSLLGAPELPPNRHYRALCMLRRESSRIQMVCIRFPHLKAEDEWLKKLWKVLKTAQCLLRYLRGGHLENHRANFVNCFNTPREKQCCSKEVWDKIWVLGVGFWQVQT